MLARVRGARGARMFLAKLHTRKWESAELSPVSLAHTIYDPMPSPQTKHPIIVAHGLFGSKLNWNTMCKRMAGSMGRRVIAVDLRNHGDSPHTPAQSYYHMAADLKGFVTEMQLTEPASFIGHSIGGRAAMALALSHNELVRDLIVIDISPIGPLPYNEYFSNLLQALNRISLDSNLTLAQGRKAADNELFEVAKNPGFRKFLTRNLIKNEVTKKFEWKLNLKAMIDNLNDIVHMPPFDQTYRKPALFICGSKSGYVKQDMHATIKKRFPKARFVYIKDSGHLVHAEKPDAFLRTVETFYQNS